MRRWFFLAVLLAGLTPAYPASVAELIQMSMKPNDDFRAALLDTLGEKNIVNGTAVLGHGADFIFAVESTATPVLYVDNEKVGKMRHLKGWHMWFSVVSLKAGRIHSFYYLMKKQRKGGRNDVAAYLPESYPNKDAPPGTLSKKLTLANKIYPGMTTDFWIYVPAAYTPDKPAALMVWQDGEKLVARDGPAKILNVVDNLIHEGKMPVTIQVFVAPCQQNGKSMRSIEYDRVDDAYARLLRDELLPEVAKRYNIRTDAYSRAIGGVSSGALCAFNTAWQQPDQFSRVLSIIGSYTSIQWQPGKREGGNIYPFKVRREAVRNIRVWLQDGAQDLEDEYGSWPLQNIQLANSLKFMGYDFHFSFGNGSHNPAQGWAELPQSLAWLWRGYDPAKTQQVYQMEPKEKKLPLFRVKIANR